MISIIDLQIKEPNNEKTMTLPRECSYATLSQKENYRSRLKFFDSPGKNKLILPGRELCFISGKLDIKCLISATAYAEDNNLDNLLKDLTKGDTIKFNTRSVSTKMIDEYYTMIKVDGVVKYRYANCVYNEEFNCDDINERLTFSLPSTQKFDKDNQDMLFFKMNYAKYCALWLKFQALKEHNIQKQINGIKGFERIAKETKDYIAQGNLGLVLSLAQKKKLTETIDYCDIISEGSLSLSNAIEHFDIRKGYKFSTYACRAIIRSFGKVLERNYKLKGFFPVQYDEEMNNCGIKEFDEQKKNNTVEDFVILLEQILEHNIAELSEIERQVLEMRYPLDKDSSPTTLKSTGKQLGLTKERIRQIQNFAFNKIRTVMENRAS